MKKFLAILLTVAMVMSMAVVTSAEEIALGGKTYVEEAVDAPSVSFDEPKVVTGFTWMIGWSGFGNAFNTFKEGNGYVKVVTAEEDFYSNWGGCGTSMHDKNAWAGEHTFVVENTDGTYTHYFSGANMLASAQASLGEDYEITTMKNIVIQPSNDEKSVTVYSISFVTLTEKVTEPETSVVEVTETVTGTFTATYSEEGTWGTDAIVDYETLSEGLKHSNSSWVNFNVNVLDLIKSVADIDDIVKIVISTEADNYESWVRETASDNESIGQQKDLGVGYSLNEDYGTNYVSYYMAGGNTWTCTAEDIAAVEGGLTMFNVKTFNGKPGSVVNFTITLKITYNKEVAAGEGTEPVEPTRGSGYIVTGDETHALIIGNAIITTKHEFDANGDCLFCHYHTDVTVEDVVVEQPTESTEEETEDVTVEEEVPATGLALAVAPMVVALGAVALSKKR